jgi:DNA-binding transcriptional ArsR family regulator
MPTRSPKIDLLDGTALVPPPVADGYLTVAEIAEMTGMSKRSVRRDLKSLAAHGIIELTPDPGQIDGYLIRVPDLRGEER